MNNQIMNNNKCNKCKNCLKLFSNDCFNKLFDKNIMAIDESQLVSRKNKKLLIDMALEQRKIVINSFGEILNYNSDFNEIVMNYLLDFSKTPIYENLFQLIKSQYSYYYYKAIIIVVIKSLLILIQLIIFTMGLFIF